MDVPSVFDGPVNVDTFRAQGEGVLVPLRMPGDVEVMGNLGHHKKMLLNTSPNHDVTPIVHPGVTGIRG